MELGKRTVDRACSQRSTQLADTRVMSRLGRMLDLVQDEEEGEARHANCILFIIVSITLPCFCCESIHTGYINYYTQVEKDVLC